VGSRFEYEVAHALEELGFHAKRRLLSGAATGQKGDVVIYDDNNNEVMTLECTKSRGKQITIPLFRLERLLNNESEAIIFALGNSTTKFAIIPWETDLSKDMTFIDYLNDLISRIDGVDEFTMMKNYYTSRR